MSAEGSQTRFCSSKKVRHLAGSPGKSRVPVPPCRGPGQSMAQIVVLEEGALRGGRPIPAAELDQTVVVAQAHGETALQLRERVKHRITMVERSGAVVAQVSVVLGHDCDEQTMAARRLLGTMVLAYANSTRGPCELVLVGEWEDRDLRQQLWALVELLVNEPGGAKAPIRLRFNCQVPLGPS